MLTFLVSSQTLKKDSITLAKKTLKIIVKESRKCDSVKVAFRQKSILLDDLVSTNLTMFTELDLERNKRATMRLQLQEVNKELLKLTKRKRSSFLYGSGGLIIGVVFTLLVSQ